MKSLKVSKKLSRSKLKKSKKKKLFK
jgi:hypothetical protein